MTSEGVSCSTIDATGPCVTVTSSTAAVPAATGGTIQAGTYDLVSAVAHFAADAALPSLLSPIRKTAILTAGTGSALNVQEADESGNYLNRFNGTITTSTSTLTFTHTCPQVDGGAPGDASYTFTAGATTTLVVTSDQGHGTMLVETWQKR